MQSQTRQNETPYQHKILTIPNLLSFFRLALIPLMVWLYAIEKQYYWTTAILFLSALTDVVDGWIARRYNMVSDFGKIIDPFADKLTLIAMLGCLATRFPAMIPLLIVLVVKEIVNGLISLLVGGSSNGFRFSWSISFAAGYVVSCSLPRRSDIASG